MQNKILTLHVQSDCIVRSTSAAFYAVYTPKANGGLALSSVEHTVKLGTLKKRNEN